MNGEIIVLSHLRPDEGAEIFGFWMYPNGNRKKLVSIIKSRSVEWREEGRKN